MRGSLSEPHKLCQRHISVVRSGVIPELFFAVAANNFDEEETCDGDMLVEVGLHESHTNDVPTLCFGEIELVLFAAHRGSFQCPIKMEPHLQCHGLEDWRFA